MRALLLELERLHNHVADLGALANDVGFGIVNAHAQRLRETLLRLNKADDRATGCCAARSPSAAPRLAVAPRPRHAARPSPPRWPSSPTSPSANSVVARPVHRDRASSAASSAAELGTLGYVARASAASTSTPDATTRSSTWADRFPVVDEHGGDVLARYLVRVREVDISAAVARDLVARLGREQADGAPGRARTGRGPGSGWSRPGAAPSSTGSSSTRRGG